MQKGAKKKKRKKQNLKPCKSEASARTQKESSQGFDVKTAHGPPADERMRIKIKQLALELEERTRKLYKQTEYVHDKVKDLTMVQDTIEAIAAEFGVEAAGPGSASVNDEGTSSTTNFGSSLWRFAPEVESCLNQLLQTQGQLETANLTSEQGDRSFFRAFLSPYVPATLCFMALEKVFRQAGTNAVQEEGAKLLPRTWLHVLARFVQQHRLTTLLAELAEGSDNDIFRLALTSHKRLFPSSSSSSSHSLSYHNSAYVQTVLSALSSLPDVLANALQGTQQIPAPFLPENFLRLVVSETIRLLESQAQKISACNVETSSSLPTSPIVSAIPAFSSESLPRPHPQFVALVASIYSKIIRLGHANAVVSVLFAALLTLMKDPQLFPDQSAPLSSSPLSSSVLQLSLLAASSKGLLLLFFRSVVEVVDVSAQEKLAVGFLVELDALEERGVGRRMLDLLYGRAVLLAASVSRDVTVNSQVSSSPSRPSPRSDSSRVLASNIHHFIHFLFLEKFIVSSSFQSGTLDLILTFLERTDRSFPYLGSSSVFFSFTPSLPASPSSFSRRSFHFVSLVLSRASELWAQPIFVRHATWQQQEYLALVIVRSLQILCPLSSPSPSSTSSSEDGDQAKPYSTADFEDLQDSMTPLMNGVQQLLSSPLQPIRGVAMQVAEHMSRILDPSKPLAFELDPATQQLLALPAWQWRWNPARGTGWTDAQEVQGASTASATKQENQGKIGEVSQESKRVIIEGAAVQRLVGNELGESRGQEPQQEEAVDSDLEGENYDLEDDEEDLRKVPLPRYLRDVLTYFGRNDREHTEAGLEAVERLIKSHLATLREVAPDLAKSLLTLSSRDALSDEKLDKTRISAMEALVVMEPLLCLPVMTKRFYSDNNTVKDRLDILSVLIGSAIRLADLNPNTLSDKSFNSNKKVLSDKKQSRQPPLSSSSHVRIPPSSSLPSTLSLSSLVSIEIIEGDEDDKEVALAEAPQQDVSGLSLDPAVAQELVRQRVEVRTKRWGHSLEPASTSRRFTINHFGPVAGSFFFPLIRNVDNPALSFSLILQDEPILLSRLLTALGVFIQCSGPYSPSTRPMARTLVDLLVVTRLHAEAAVRRATLFALSRVLSTLPHHIFQEDFLEEIEELIQWLMQTYRQEPDAHTRSMARLCLSSIKDSVEDIKPLPPSGPLRPAGIQVVSETQSIGLGTTPSSLQFLG
eukprot:gb/GEZN01000723.1/.p1 GENE.gb/GEZN01000723.1/~~gb/GEZN01000723.1/.p1  ORF type:complete len:1205 (+),score=228.96 gb/GEZN01000723.1/:167-3781(+)